MPRLTDETYLLTRTRLVTLWNTEPNLFAVLKPGEQWALHDYYAVAEKLSRDEAIAHRKSIADEALPQRAGRAVAKLTLGLQELEEKRKRPSAPMLRKAKRRIVAHSVVNPALDPDAFAKLIVQLSMEEARMAKPKSDQ